MGRVEYPRHIIGGRETKREVSAHFFAIGHDTMPPALLRAFGVLKLASAQVNEALGKLDHERAALIERAGGVRVIDGALMSEFPLRDLSERLGNPKRT